MDAVFSAEATVDALLEFEKCLAQALVEVGVAPEAEVGPLVDACGKGVSDAAAILATTWDAGTPILALRNEITARLDDEPASWFHFGATTQDAVDTASMLQARSALSVMESGLTSAARRLTELTSEFRDTPHMGRTFLQDARPTTFGLRTAGWLDAILGHIESGRSLSSLVPVQLGGSNGTRSELGSTAPEVVAALAARLGLADSPTVWHGDRSIVWSLAQYLELTTRTMAKLGTDIAYLASTSVGELRVRAGGSSSMPGKENPLDSIRAVAAASACSGAVAMLSMAPPLELDRGVGGWHVEWIALPLAFATAAASLDAIVTCLESVEVDVEAMGARVSGELAPEGAQAQIDHVLAKAAVTMGDG